MACGDNGVAVNAEAIDFHRREDRLFIASSKDPGNHRCFNGTFARNGGITMLRPGLYPPPIPC
jgi:hypothetical protein